MAVFSERELDVMSVLWDGGPSTAAEVRDALAAHGLDLAYNTVLTVLRILEDKGHVTHTVDGRAHRYVPLVAREEAEAGAVRRLVRTLFRGSPELLMTHLVRDRSVTPDTVRRLRALLDAADPAPNTPAPPAASHAARPVVPPAVRPTRGRRAC